MTYKDVLFWGFFLGLGFILVDYHFIPGGTYDSPKLKCQQMYVTDEDMSECIWLLENQPALR